MFSCLISRPKDCWKKFFVYVDKITYAQQKKKNDNWLLIIVSVPNQWILVFNYGEGSSHVYDMDIDVSALKVPPAMCNTNYFRLGIKDQKP